MNIVPKLLHKQKQFIGGAMLDDLKYIHQRDKGDALGVAEKQWQQLQYDYKIEFRPKQTIQNVVIAGMGGSALAATYVSTWPTVDVPFEIVRDYDIPSYINESTLFVASSYSGNTEETLNAINKAEQKNAEIVVISSGGKLAELANQKGYPLYKLPSDLQPRMAVFYNFAVLVRILVAANLVDAQKIEEINASGEFLKPKVVTWRPDIATDKNIAKQIALELVGKSPVIYASPKMFPVAYKWKINMNENAKNIAWCNQLPEFNHNEFLGWSSHPLDKPYKPVFLQSNFDSPQITKRFDVSKKLLSGRMPEPITVVAEGKTLLEQMVWTIALGDFVSLYLALLNNLDPTPVDLIEKLKKEL